VRAFVNAGPEAREQWLGATRALAEVNAGVLRRVAEQLRHGQGPEHADMAGAIERILAEVERELDAEYEAGQGEGERQP
jgi:hypothetical protein